METTMYKTFNLYSEERQDHEFQEQFDELCANIVLSDISFEEYWENHALPVLLNCGFENEKDLLSEFNWGGSMMNPSNWGSANRNLGGGAPQTDQYNQRMRGNNQSMQNGDEEREMRRQTKLKQYQQTIDQSVQNVKNEFIKQMRDFLSAMQSNATQENDYIGWKIAKAFYDRLMKASQPMIDNFAMKAKFGKRDDTQFQKGREGLQRQRQQAIRRRHPEINQGNAPVQQAAMSPQ